MIETSIINSYDRIKSQINLKIDEYKELCVDDLGVLHSYFLVKHRDNLSFNANRDGIRSEIYAYANAICSAYNIDLKACNKKLGAIHNKYKNKPEHYEEVDKAVSELMILLRSKAVLPKAKTIDNKTAEVMDRISNFSQDEIDNLLAYIDNKKSNVKDNKNSRNSEFNERGLRDRELFSEAVYELCTDFNVSIKRKVFGVFNYYSALHNDGIKMNYSIAYIICDNIGEDTNIGVYVGIDETENYFIIPLGARYLNENYNAYIKTVPIFDDNLEDFKNRVKAMLLTYYRYKY